MPHIDAPSRTPEFFPYLLFAALGLLVGALIGTHMTRTNIIDQCVQNERFFDRSLRYFCTPWPADKANEEETYEEDQDLESSIQS